MHRRHVSSLRRLGLLLLCLAALPTAATAQGSPVDVWKAEGGLGTEYQTFANILIPVQAVKAVPFFQMTDSARIDRVQSYYQTARADGLGKAAGAVKEDFFNQALLGDVFVTFMTTTLTQMSQGTSADESMNKTIKYITSSEYLVGNLLCGMVGAAIGSMIPVPFVGGMLGEMIAAAPMMYGAMAGSLIGANLVHHIKDGNPTHQSLFDGVDFGDLALEAVGASAGMILGRSLGVGFLGEVVGGALGAHAGHMGMQWLRDHLGPHPSSVGPSTPASSALAMIPAAPAAPSASPARGQLYLSYLAAERAGDHAQAARLYQLYAGLSH